MRGERVKADRMFRDKGCVVPLLRADHVHHRQCQRAVSAGADDQHVVRLGGRRGAAHVDRHDMRAAAFRGQQMPCGIRLAREVGCPEDDEPGMLAHVLLRIGLEHAGQPESEGPQAPADHGRIPEVAAVEICETGE